MRTVPPAETEREDRLVTGPILFRVMTAGNLRASGGRHRLGKVDSIILARGAVCRAERDMPGTLTLTIADPSMSSRHARLHRAGSEWQLEDLGSTHGTRVNGAVWSRGVVRDGAVIEAGSTFFVFREVLPDLMVLPDDLNGDESAAMKGLRTLDPDLAMRFREATRLAHSSVPIYLSGPTGSGKELLARAIHELSGRSGAFVAVNCAALTDSLAESELFGYKKGAFSGADADRDGLIAASSGGTLFLDEVAELTAKDQARLLRVVQECEVRPIGAVAAEPVDLRLLCATHKDLGDLVAGGAFREDLFARLVGAQINVPALCKRTVDLGMLLADVSHAIERPTLELTQDAARSLLFYTWPQNVRELHQIMARAAALSPDDTIRSTELPDTLVNRARKTRAASDDDELRAQLIALLKAHRGNVSAVARAMGKGRRQVQRWLERYELRAADFAG